MICLKLLFPNIQICCYIYKNINLTSIAEIFSFLKAQILLFNLSYHIWLIISKNPCLQIIDLSKALIMHIKRNNISLNTKNFMKKIFSFKVYYCNKFDTKLISLKIFDYKSLLFFSFSKVFKLQARKLPIMLDYLIIYNL